MCNLLPGIGYFCNEDKNIDKEAVFIKEGALALAHQLGIYMSEEEIDKFPVLAMPVQHAWTLKLIINSLVQYYVWQHVHLFAGRRRRMATSMSVSMLELVDLFF